MKKKVFTRKNLAFCVLLLIIFLEIICSKRLINPRQYFNNTAEENKTSEWVDLVKGWDLPTGELNYGPNEKGTNYVSESKSRELKIYEVLDADKLVNIYGASYAFGHGLNIEEVFSTLLQEEFDDIKIQNKSVPLYGTVQMLLKFKEDLKIRGEKPELVFLSWLDFHTFRSINSNSNKVQISLMFSNLSIGSKPEIPYIKQHDNTTSYAYSNPNEYLVNTNWFLRNSALCFNLFYRFNFFVENINYEKKFNLSKLVLNDFKELCEENEIQLYILGMNMSNQELIETWCEEEGVNFLNCAFSEADYKEYTQENDVYHPNAKAHLEYYEKCSEILNERLTR